MKKRDMNKCFELLRNKDEAAFEEIYHQMKTPVFTVIFRIVQDFQISEDIMQELFVKIFLSPPDDSVLNPKAYIFQMARNLSIDALRCKNNKQMSELEETTVFTDGEFTSLLFHIDLEKAISKLSVEEREIISLYLNCGLKFREISKVVGLSIPAVYRKYTAALKFLRDEMNGGSL